MYSKLQLDSPISSALAIPERNINKKKIKLSEILKI